MLPGPSPGPVYVLCMIRERHVNYVPFTNHTQYENRKGPQGDFEKNSIKCIVVVLELCKVQSANT